MLGSILTTIRFHAFSDLESSSISFNSNPKIKILRDTFFCLPDLVLVIFEQITISEDIGLELFKIVDQVIGMYDFQLEFIFPKQLAQHTPRQVHVFSFDRFFDEVIYTLQINLTIRNISANLVY
jgi:hypothetical protein